MLLLHITQFNRMPERKRLSDQERWWKEIKVVLNVTSYVQGMDKNDNPVSQLSSSEKVASIPFYPIFLLVL